MNASARTPTTNEALTTHGLTGTQLMGLVRKAINDELGKRSIYLPPADYEDLHSKTVEMAIGLAHNHDPTKGTLSLTTRIYRTARWRTLDHIRRERIPAATRHADLDGTEPDTIDIADIATSKIQRQTWQHAATKANLTLIDWVTRALEQAAAEETH